MISKRFSDNIHIVSFFCTIMVVFRHSLNMQAFGIDSFGNSYVVIIENGVSKLTEVAVPYFFVVSGYFFFRYTYYGKGEYVKMIRKKFHTLFVPFVFWNIMGVVPLVLTRHFVVEDNPWRYGLQLLNSDWSGVLWYVRDIMTMMVLAPLYCWIFLVDKKWIYGIVLLLLFLNWMPVDCGWLSSEGMLFFFLGGVLQKCNVSLNNNVPNTILVVMCIVWLISCFAFPRYWPIHRYNTLLGLVVVWQLCKFFPSWLSMWMLGSSAYSFFIYVLHADIVKLMKVCIAKMFPGNESVALLAYVIIPILTVLVVLKLGKVINEKFPRAYGFAVGGRR